MNVRRYLESCLDSNNWPVFGHLVHELSGPPAPRLQHRVTQVTRSHTHKVHRTYTLYTYKSTHTVKPTSLYMYSETILSVVSVACTVYTLTLHALTLPAGLRLARRLFIP